MKEGTIVKHKLTGQRMIVLEKARIYAWSGIPAPLIKCQWESGGKWDWHCFPETSLEEVD